MLQMHIIVTPCLLTYLLPPRVVLKTGVNVLFYFFLSNNSFITKKKREGFYEEKGDVQSNLLHTEDSFRNLGSYGLP